MVRVLFDVIMLNRCPGLSTDQRSLSHQSADDDAEAEVLFYVSKFMLVTFWFYLIVYLLLKLLYLFCVESDRIPSI